MTKEQALYELERMKTWSEDLSDDEIEALAFALRAIGENEKLISKLFDMQNKIADSIVYNAKLLQEIEDLKAIIKSNKATIQEQRELRTSLMQIPTADVVKRSTMEILCIEYLSKCNCCDECCAEYFCIENQLKTEKRDCVNNLITYFAKRNIGE